MARVGETRNAVHRARGDRLGVVERRQDRFERSREHRLARTWRADEEQVVASRCRDLERALGGLLPGDVLEIHRMPHRIGTRRDRRGGNARPTLEMLDDVAKRREAERVDTAGGRLSRVRRRDEHFADATLRGMSNAWHRASDRTKPTIERELAEAKSADVNAQLSARAKDPEGDRELEPGTFFSTLGRRQVHRDATQRELEAGIADRGAHALARLLHGCVRQTHHDEVRQAVRDVDLDGHEGGLESPERAGGDARDGARGRWPFRRRDRDGEGRCATAGATTMGPSTGIAVLAAPAN